MEWDGLERYRKEGRKGWSMLGRKGMESIEPMRWGGGNWGGTEEWRLLGKDTRVGPGGEKSMKTHAKVFLFRTVNLKILLRHSLITTTAILPFASHKEPADNLH